MWNGRFTQCRFHGKKTTVRLKPCLYTYNKTAAGDVAKLAQGDTTQVGLMS